MSDEEQYGLVLFESVHHALRAEKILKNAGIPHKLIPVPKHISSDCGICVRFTQKHKTKLEQALRENNVQFLKISTLR